MHSNDAWLQEQCRTVTRSYAILFVCDSKLKMELSVWSRDQTIPRSATSKVRVSGLSLGDNETSSSFAGTCSNGFSLLDENSSAHHVQSIMKRAL
jgi:hypothetical protein